MALQSDPHRVKHGVFLALQHLGYISVLSANNSIAPQTSTLLIGFAFYFLQLLGLVISVLNEKIPLPSKLDFFVGITYFPKFLSGPIEPIAFLDQVKQFKFRLQTSALEEGLPYILMGAIFKFIFALHLQSLVNLSEIASPVRVLTSTLAFEFQVYFDFGGYSLMAYGVSLIIGLPVLLNFQHPFAAKDVPEFWRRWHIGLGRWFHTYIYEPGKNVFALSPWKKVVLPIMVFLISAVWHGQTMNFLIWGTFHGLAFVSFIFLSKKIPFLKKMSRLHLFLTLIVGRFFFMDPNMSRIISKIGTLFTLEAWARDMARLTDIFADFSKRLGPQGEGIVYVACGIIISEIILGMVSDRNEHYGLFRNNFAFTIATASFLALLPLVAQFGFVYGR